MYVCVMNIKKLDEFNNEDPHHKGYSLLEVDLPAKTGLTLVKNLMTGDFEIIEIKTRKVIFKGTIYQVALYAEQVYNDSYFKKEYFGGKV